MMKLPIISLLAAALAFSCTVGGLRAATEISADSPEVRAEIAKFGKIETSVYNSWGKIHDGMSIDDINAIVGSGLEDFNNAVDTIVAKIEGTNFAVTMSFECVVTDITAKDAGEDGYKESRFIYRIGNYTMVFDCEGKMVAHRRSAASETCVFMTGD